MKRRTVVYVLTIVTISIIGLLSLVLSASVSVGAPVQANPTDQQQTINAIINQRFTQTAQVQQQLAITQTINAAFNQALTATAAFQKTIDVGFNQALTATALVQVTSGAATLKAGGIPVVTANKDWTPQTKTFDGVEMVLVPPGCFLMGSSDADIAAINKQYNTSDFSDEAPQTKICFDKPFWIDKMDVTQAQFKRLGGTAAHSSSFTGDNRPVENITWFEARDFCVKRGARLPTEAEWEYAARGPDNMIYPWGNTFVADNVVYAGNSINQTADVGSKPLGASWVGALDMSGNVVQWVSTLYKPYPYSKEDGRESNTDTIIGRGLRGSTWSTFGAVVPRAAYRGWDKPSNEDNFSGFRCARF